ncbi:hypothetical protein BJ742DRAFT_773830 [Cladochytrium replicatum]|nr:hypothetical protein BJ742DRAFT_773830 [Cladochytrium replicatum]
MILFLFRIVSDGMIPVFARFYLLTWALLLSSPWISYPSSAVFFSAIECVFSVYYVMFLLRPIHRHRSADYLPPMSSTEFTLFLDEMDQMTPTELETYMDEWTMGTFPHLQSQFWPQWTSIILFHQPPESLSDAQRSQMKAFIALLERKMPDGTWRGDIGVTKSMFLTVDPLTIRYRPLVYYAAIFVIKEAMTVFLRSRGFQRVRCSPFHYYIRRGGKQRPIVFFHGLGVGIVSYVTVLLEIAKACPQRTILFWEIPTISMHFPFQSDQLLESVFLHHFLRTLRHEQLDDLVLVGHSVGTAFIRWLDNQSLRIHHRIFLDPICFQLWHPYTISHVLYRPPQSYPQRLMHYYAFTEYGIHLYLRRYFCWFRNTYFSKEIPKATAFLSEMDDVVDTTALKRYLARFGQVQTRVMTGMHHAECLIRKEARKEIVRCIADMANWQ